MRPVLMSVGNPAMVPIVTSIWVRSDRIVSPQMSQ